MYSPVEYAVSVCVSKLVLFRKREISFSLYQFKFFSYLLWISLSGCAQNHMQITFVLPVQLFSG